MPANVDALVQEGISSLRENRRNEAKQALTKAVEIDESNEQAWLWLSAVVDTLDEREICLSNVLALNPNNAKAKKGLDETRKEIAARTAPRPPAAGTPPSTSISPFGDYFSGANSPFAGTGFDANPYAATNTTASDPALSGWTGFDTVPSSVDWGTPPANRAPTFDPSPSPQEYDSWMAGLPINSGQGSSEAGGGSTAFSAFEADPFAAPARNSAPSADPFGGSGFDADPFSAQAGGGFNKAASTFADPFAADPFAASASPVSTNSPFGDFSFESPIPPPAPAQETFAFDKPVGGSVFDFGTDDPFAKSGSGASPAPIDRAPIAPKMTAASSFDMLESFPAPTFADEGDDDAESSPFSFPSSPAPVTKPPSGGAISARVALPPSSGSAIFTTIDSTPSLNNPAIYFQQIPPEIQIAPDSTAKRYNRPTATSTKAARSPRSNTLLIAVILLVLLNIGSLLFLLVNITNFSR